MLVKTQEEVRELAAEVRGLGAEVRELASMQKRTEATLQAFINSMKRGGNGHSKKPVGLS
jgi:transposase